MGESIDSDAFSRCLKQQNVAELKIFPHKGRTPHQNTHPSQRTLFGREEASYIKGVAIIMLILHHLFFLPSGNPWFTPLFGGYWGGIEFFLSSIGKLCIPLFFFVSGYGLWQASCSDSHLWKSTLLRIRNIYGIYIVTVAVTVLLLSLTSGSWVLLSKRHALETFLGTNVAINGSWWFFIIYIELLLLTPLSVVFVRRTSWWPTLLLSTLLYLLSPESGLSFFADRIEMMGLGSYFYGAFPVKLFWYNQLYFYTGFCLAAGGIVERILHRCLARLSFPPLRFAIATLLLVAVCFTRYFLIDIGALFGVLSRDGLDIFSYTQVTARADFVLGPLFILSLLLLFYGRSLPTLKVLGRQSAPIWLIHTSIIGLLTLTLHSFRPWSPLFFLLVLGLSSLYAKAYFKLVQVVTRKL